MWIETLRAKGIARRVRLEPEGADVAPLKDGAGAEEVGVGVASGVGASPRYPAYRAEPYPLLYRGYGD